MKRVLTLLLLAFTLSVSAQNIQPTKPYRSPTKAMVKDSAFAAGQMLIPVFTAPNLGLWYDTPGQSFGFNKNNNRLSVRGTGAWFEFPSFTEVQSMIGAIPVSNLENVTTGTNNNVTTNVAWFTGLNNFTGVKNGVLIGKGLVGYYNPTDFPSEPTRWNITSINDGPTEEGLLINYRNGVNANIQLRPQTSLKAGVILSDGISPTGRLELADAINNTEATTLGQVNSLISGITGFVDLTTNQDVNGRKTFKDLFTIDISTDDTDYRTDVVVGQYNILLRNVDSGTEPEQRKLEINDSSIELDMPGANILMGTDGIRIGNLAGTGTRMVTVDPSGLMSTTSIPSLSGYELLSNKQNSLTVDGSGNKYPTVDAINTIGNGLIHTTGTETKNGRLILTSPAGTAGIGGTSVSPIAVQGGTGGSQTTVSAFMFGGNASGITIRGGNGGDVIGLAGGTGVGGAGAGLTIAGGNGGQVLGGTGTKSDGAGGGLNIIGGIGEVGGTVAISGGDASATATNPLGGDVNITGGNATSAINKGKVRLSASNGETLVGIAGGGDGATKFQVGGNMLVTGSSNTSNSWIGNFSNTSSLGDGLRVDLNSGATNRTALKVSIGNTTDLFTVSGIGDATLRGKLDFGTISTVATTPGSLGYNDITGSFFIGKTGSTYDYTLYSAAGGPVSYLPTGTDRLHFPQSPTMVTESPGSNNLRGATTAYVDAAIATVSGPTILSGSAVLDFPDTPAGNLSSLTLTVTGAAVNDVVAMSVPTFIGNNVSWYAMVAGPNTVRIVFVNNSTIPIDPSSSLTFNVKVFK